MNVIQALEIGESLCASEAEQVLAGEVRELREQLAQERKRLDWTLDEATARAERAEAEMRQEPVATVYIGSAHCKVAFTDAAKEAMKGRQGQSFDVYADPMPRTVKDSLTAESTAAQVPQEWRDVMAELAADLQAACEADHPHREQYPSIMRKYQNNMAIVERARALLQEVKP